MTRRGFLFALLVPLIARGRRPNADITTAIINQHRALIIAAFASDSYVANSLDIQHEPIYDS